VLGQFFLQLKKAGLVKKKKGKIRIKLLSWGDGTTLNGGPFIAYCLAFDPDPSVFNFSNDSEQAFIRTWHLIYLK
jgi:hypothetical protein